MIKAVILDLNEIFLQSPKLSERFEKDFSIKSSIFLPKLFEIMEKVRQSNADKAFSYWKPVLKEWNINFSEAEFWDYWFNAEIPSEKMIDYSKLLRGTGIKVFILSNNFKERSEYYDHYSWIHDAVDKVYFSWQTGLAKPDIKAWELILMDNNLKSEECLYFDDQEKNVQSAQSIGIKSFVFTNEAELERVVNQHLAY